MMYEVPRYRNGILEHKVLNNERSLRGQGSDLKSEKRARKCKACKIVRIRGSDLDED